MEYNVSHLLKSGIGTTREYDIEPEALSLDTDIQSRVLGGHVRFDRTNTGVLARGTVRAAVGLTCSRCIDPIDVPVDAEFAEEFEPSIDVSTGRPLTPSDNDLAFPISEQHILDLGEALRQNLIAALPIQPLCRPDCIGLCPSCGTNRNTDPCTCVQTDENRPLAKLAMLLEDRP